MKTNIDYLLLLIIILIFFIIFKKNNYKLSKYFNLLDYPDTHLKKHKIPVPRSGGTFLYIVFLLTIIIQNIYFDHSENYFSIIDVFFISLIFLIGILDDKINLKPNLKLFLLFLGVIIYLNYNNELLINIIKISTLDLEFNVVSVNYLITTLCILLFINASNMFDGSDGQSGFYFLFLFSFLSYAVEFNASMFSLLISLLLFLYLNMKKFLFLGDSGVFFLSFIFSIIAIKSYKQNLLISEEIVLLMLLPGIDMLRLFIQRILKKKNPFKGDREHFHHLLQKKFDYNKSLIIIISLAILPNIIAYIFNAYLAVMLLTITIYLSLILNFNIKNKWLKPKN